ncbi:hypothetical protein [Neisseria montereyensis]|uniref:DUF2726 domain-containing protein n=1 Tax=Neisseria montereyensis TaxID=2973938 RepID=A0ABT2F9T6_9NEIS|nr:hypothetical protein [Neisseria montereyensis]MCS4532907.1 hypothetical protein [Neisseria montereyensis]
MGSILNNLQLLGIAAMILAALLLMYWGITVYRNTQRESQPAYQLSFHSSSHPLAPQVFADTCQSLNIFTQYNNPQDERFLAQYPIGRTLAYDGESYLISRVKKYLTLDDKQQPQFGYAVYFQVYEKSEFPLHIGFTDQKRYIGIMLDAKGCTVIQTDGKISRLPYAELCVKIRRQRFTMKTPRYEHTIKRSDLSLADGTLLAAVLQKYAAKLDLDTTDIA